MTSTTDPLLFCQDVLDHFKCYKTKPTAFSPMTVPATDQFGSGTTSVLRTYRFCNPADKNQEGMHDPTAHLMCYQSRDSAGTSVRNITVQNQFGTQQLVALKNESVCVPAEKNGVASALNLDRFKCYQVRKRPGADRFPALNVSVADQFETKTTTVVKPFLICNPADVSNSGTLHDACHLACYKIKDAGGQTPFAPHEITEQDEFHQGGVNAVGGTCSRVSLLCVPSLKFEQ